MKNNNFVLFVTLICSLHLYSQKVDLSLLPKYDCSQKKWVEFSKDTVIIVKPTNISYPTDALTKNFYGFLNYKYVEKTENELSKEDLKKSLLIIGKASDYKKWKKFNLPIKKRKEGFVFNNIEFCQTKDALWFNDCKRLVITANNHSALKTIFDIGQLGMDFFTIQNNQLTYFGNIVNDDSYKINSYNIQDLKKSNYRSHKVGIANFYISKNLNDSIDVEKINNNLKEHVDKYASFFKITVPKNKIDVLFHSTLNEMSNMLGLWGISCGGSSAGMNVRGEIHCIGSNQELINHEISHHVFNSNIPADKLPPFLLEGVVEVFTNYANPNLYQLRINNAYNNWTKFNLKEFFENGNSFYNSNSYLNYEVAGIWVKYFIDTYGLKTFKSLCLSDDKITFITSLTKVSFEDFTKRFKLWMRPLANQN